MRQVMPIPELVPIPIPIFSVPTPYSFFLNFPYPYIATINGADSGLIFRVRVQLSSLVEIGSLCQKKRENKKAWS